MSILQHQLPVVSFHAAKIHRATNSEFLNVPQRSRIFSNIPLRRDFFSLFVIFAIEKESITMQNIYLLIYSLLLALALSFSACRQSKPDRLLARAEALIPTNPDSAYCLLNSVVMPEKFSERAYSEWCFLLTKARDKSYRPHFSDREIRHAVDFFRAEGDAHRLADACYTAGRVNTDLNRPDDAARFYLEAESAAVPTGDYSLLYLIAAQRGTLYARQDLISEAAESYQKALHYAEASGDSAYLAEAYQHIGRIYGMKREWAKADSCCRLAVDICRKIGDWDALCGTLNEQAGYAIYSRNFDLAEQCYQTIQTIPAKHLERNKYQLYLGKGDMYRLKGDYKQAIPYLEKAAQSNNIYTKSASYLALYCLYKDQKVLDRIIQYSDLYIDS